MAPPWRRSGGAGCLIKCLHNGLARREQPLLMVEVHEVAVLVATTRYMVGSVFPAEKNWHFLKL